jgi:hypothetical protein
MVVNFKARRISRGTRKLAWTHTLIKKKKLQNQILMGIAQLVKLEVAF